MELTSWFYNSMETQLKGRYISSEHILPLFKIYSEKSKISTIGSSEMGKVIPMITIGNGKKNVLAWSQMHGNESTTTKALFDFLKFINQREFLQSEIETFLNGYTVHIIPMLNPDGAAVFTRENANNVDLNRDAKNLSQKESQCLRQIFDNLKPDLCLNMHDQRSIFGFENGEPAAISFLSPASDGQRSITESRKKAMKHIVKMNRFLQKVIPGKIGRFDDGYNENCTGDSFQKMNVPTILFEAGHHDQDYSREKSREYLFYSLLALFEIVGDHKQIDYSAYFKIPENQKNYRDIIIRNIAYEEGQSNIDLAIQYSEILKDGTIQFIPKVDEIGNLNHLFGHREKDAKDLEISDFKKLLNNSENLIDIVSKI
ncbi:M14 family zinc carboxypeptidase [Aequorivita echinoideorum]|uniref:DUF2817 domain-containing protein n=1 Tax=Aequorivita echinoideorum TaxID=1549647 RepID=A0ABS5S8K9_9FLAO|nr:M14 family zinc carboxypeptidase [Aequorivita echinoideorum]MBT0608760.1 DUF2817 domain-containing protein [Aequorivita echinoideorum]